MHRFPRWILLLLSSATVLAAATTGPVAATPQEARPLAVGARAPGFVLQTPDGADFDLTAALAGKNTLLVFYRGGWCPFCNRHLAALAEIEPALLELGIRIIAISPDEPADLKPTIEKQKLNYTLLSDRTMQATAAYGLAFAVDTATRERYAQHKINLAPLPGSAGPERWLPVPGVFLVNRTGTIAFAHTDPDYRNRIGNDALLAAARAAVK